jgi:GNAT superfamily N-acetyltransferase
VPATTTYLELRDRGQVRAAPRSEIAYVLVEVEDPAPEFARFLYATVGADWAWTDRLVWSRDDWQSRLSLPGVETWVMWVAGAPAGYFELDSRLVSDAAAEVELAYFGLLPAYIGKRLGGVLLEAALRRAWAMNDGTGHPTSRVWVHTSTLDGPHALANYQSRGLSIYKTEERAAG